MLDQLDANTESYSNLTAIKHQEIDLKNTFKAKGYLHYKSIEVDHFSKLLLTKEFEKLEKDPFAPTHTQRFRRYGNALILPWEKDLKPIWLPTVRDNIGQELSGYDQGGNNPEHQSIRYFNALSQEAKSTQYLNDLIVDDYQLTFGLENAYLPIYVGVHFVKLRSTHADQLGVSSPNCFHQDGEPFTFAHLFYRSNNIEGGENFIASPQERNKRLDEVNNYNIYQKFTLRQASESFAVHDPAVSHYVSPIRKIDQGTNAEAGERWMILIDFSLTKQKI